MLSDHRYLLGLRAPWDPRSRARRHRWTSRSPGPSRRTGLTDLRRRVCFERGPRRQVAGEQEAHERGRGERSRMAVQKAMRSGDRTSSSGAAQCCFGTSA